jgi:dTDP-4-amino-4,6-dideoxygalactose transaminase
MTETTHDFIPHSRPTLGEEEARAAADVVRSGHIAEGRALAGFEEAMRARLGIGHAIGTSSGTAALHLVLAAMEVGPGDEVIIPSFVCSALLNAVALTGATAVPSEIDPRTLNLDPADVKGRLNEHTKAVIVPHLFGLPVDLDAFLNLGVPIVEDCAQAVGGTHRGRPLGTSGTASVFSFYATKLIAAGEGGMVATASAEVARRVRDLKSYDRKEPWRPRYNYKLSDIQAAVGSVQLGRLESFIGRRRAIARRYRAALGPLGVGLPPDAPGHVYFRFVVDLGSDATGFLDQARRRGVACERPVHTPIHRLLNLTGYPLTERAWSRCVSLPIYPSLTDAETERVIAVATYLIPETAG